MLVTVLGASKGCARAMVVDALAQENNTLEFTLLVRNPDKVEYTDEQKAKINWIKGDALDQAVVHSAIKGADVVVTSLGSAMDLAKRKMLNPGLCANGMKVLLEAAAALDTSDRPKRMVVLSTTGLEGMREVPLLFRPMYHFLLHEPHEDKLNMETLVINNTVIDSWIIVRPSLLTDGAKTGKYRFNENIKGYTISRNDVGHFLYSQCLEEQNANKLNHKKVVVTY
ncbi:hypothetical protein Unana1_05575 [Umbelopsis nana]